ncbi:MAG: sugar ABC transporter permease [Butyrivibrio sp.]|uniref:carbohydrate ABC transporter permease n=1 Tax=Butyrivibrio sp. TaxID=28121 RepID=UPI0025E1FA14|nr:sugar ABC transporter permease [Butyrivibrio sp.]MCR5770781.1 sugar ABC transporter permease [Butyrivibrio sp.]
MKILKKFKPGGSHEGLASFLMLLPAIIFLCVCSIYPFIWIFKYICYNYNGFTATYTGSANFERMLSDKTFWMSVVHTFEYAFYKLIFIIPLALIIAVILHTKIKGANFFRGIYFMPTVISSSIAGMIFTFIFATKNGILNSLLETLHIISSPIPWLTGTDVVMAAVTILAIWGGFGNYMLYFTSGMDSISNDVYESAKIDGANGVQTFFYITLPMLSPVLKVVLMLAITGAFKDYEAIMVLSDGGPGNRSMVMFLYIYRMIFGSATSSSAIQIGYGALLSVVAAVIVGIVTAIYLFVSRKLDEVV